MRLTLRHLSAHLSLSLLALTAGHSMASSIFILAKWHDPMGAARAGYTAPAGHSRTHIEQSTHSLWSIARKFGPSLKQSVGHTLTQHMYLQLMQPSHTMWAMLTWAGRSHCARRAGVPCILFENDAIAAVDNYARRAHALRFQTQLPWPGCCCAPRPSGCTIGST